LNDTDSAIVFKRNSILGTASLADELEVPEQSASTPHVNVTRTKEGAASDRIPEHLVDLYNRSSQGLKEPQKAILKALLIEFQDVFASSEFDLGCFEAILHRIALMNHTQQPIRERMRRTPKGFEHEEEKHLEQMLAAGVIQPSNSPWAAAPVLVRKKDGGVRWCLDYRKLNAVTKKDAFPLPLISDCIETLAGTAYMSTLDMASGYWQIEIHPDDQEKTAFITRYGLFEYRRMSFGLCNAPSTFQRAMNLVLRGLTWKSVLAFLDDVMVLGETFEEHISNLREVLLRFRAHNLKLKPKKCALLRTKVKFLGKIVSGNTIEVDPESLGVVREWPVPTKTREVESFLGFVNYHREHIPHLAEIAGPLYNLTGKAPFLWEDTHTKAFNSLKEALLTAEVLSLPKEEGTFILDTDASNTAIGGQLSQKQGDTIFPIAFASKKLTPAQKKYCTTRKELLALIAFTRQFRHYLLGRPFLVRTDHNSLAWLMRFKEIEGQLARWLEELAQFDMSIVHRKGKQHVNADALSRIPDDIPSCDCYRAGLSLENLPCGGCPYCSRAQKQWARFEEDVDNVVPLASVRVVTPAAASASIDSSSVPKSCNWASNLIPNDRGAIQDADPDLATVKNWLASGETPTSAMLAASSPTVKTLWASRSLLNIENGSLWYTWKIPVRPLWVVPQSLRHNLLALAHDNVTAGHLGVTKTLEKLRRHFHWPHISADVRMHVTACPACGRQKHAKRNLRAPLCSFTTGAPMERVHIDVLGPFPRSEKGNKYVLMIVDQFTKWSEAFPLPDQTAESVAKTALNRFFAQFGCPREICTDQGSNFTSAIFSALCNILQIAKTRTTPYHPSANGQVERYNRTVLQMIRCTLDGDQHNWDDQLPLLMSALRSTVNRTTGFTPNMLMLGRETTQPLDLMTGFFPESTTLPVFIQRLQSDLSKAHRMAREALQSHQVRQKKEYDLRTVSQKFNVGDLVYLANSATKVGQCKKLSSVWLGPYLVIEVLSPVLMRVASPRREWVVHHDRLRPCREVTLPPWLRRRRNLVLSQPQDTSSSEPQTSSIGSSDPDDSEDSDEPLFCLCRGPDDGTLMVACDQCEEWFHVHCLTISEREAKDMDVFTCPFCA
jgi:transposase InsO family protein